MCSKAREIWVQVEVDDKNSDSDSAEYCSTFVPDFVCPIGRAL